MEFVAKVIIFVIQVLLYGWLMGNFGLAAGLAAFGIVVCGLFVDLIDKNRRY